MQSWMLQAVRALEQAVLSGPFLFLNKFCRKSRLILTHLYPSRVKCALQTTVLCPVSMPWDLSFEARMRRKSASFRNWWRLTWSPFVLVQNITTQRFPGGRFLAFQIEQDMMTWPLLSGMFTSLTHVWRHYITWPKTRHFQNGCEYSATKSLVENLFLNFRIYYCWKTINNYPK